jgi:energy-coupling factor transport system permease protein
MSLSFYRPTGSFIEGAHPVAKLICLMLSFVPPFFSSHPLQVLPFFLLLFITALFVGAGANLRRVGFLMFILFAMSVLIWTFFYQGQTVLYSLGPMDIKAESLSYGITIGLRINCFILAALIFLTATRIEDFAYGLSRLGMPYAASFALTLAFRLTPLFMETGQTIVMAQKARGLDLDSGELFTRIRQYVPIIVPVLVSGLRKADQLAIALESKGFGRRGKRTVYTEYSVTWRDMVLLLGTVLSGTALGLNYYLFRWF